MLSQLARAAVRSRAVAAAARGPAAVRSFTASAASRGMEDFFPREQKEGEPVQAAGRAWLASELRLKSFDDLHRLWFLCLKERNMLLTERLYYKQVGQAQPDPHRLQKVKATMARIRVVLWERARAKEAMEADAKRKEAAAALAPEVAKFPADMPAEEVAEELVKEVASQRRAAEAALRAAKAKEVVVTYKRFGREHSVPASEAPAKPTRQQRAKIARKAAFWSKVTGWRQELVNSLGPVGVAVPPVRPVGSKAPAAAEAGQA